MSNDLNIPSLFDVKGKVAVVTGGGSGIGTMIAAAYVQNGAKVYIAARKEKQLKDVCDTLNAKGPGSCHYFIADLSTKAGCDKLAASIKERESKVDILVNNSGISWGARYEDFAEVGWDRVLALNVKSIFYLTVALTDVLAKDATSHEPARVINISSIAGLTPIPYDDRLTGGNGAGLWSYNTSKAAVNHLTTQLASTLTSKHITVNAILPGIFPSKMTAFGFNRSGEDKMSKENPSGRLGDPRDMAGVALFLASPAAAYVTGTHIVVDGGDVISTKAKAKL
ncbi:rhamnolipids biosynthesis 3-oxoacyl-reductase [Rhodofomes roseus]|uniref:Rhamnolipids biosynthesis 3-oxoacyl-reductase n=1 Tax=Rhodofomes roseus TaxID=34475 RepID=A0ABQ8KBN0_9APHY|nr:rhamnolipids biosynthesis 3-oxoacyl-reductase [Rhodofomes roseus]KAH9834838.1 rhamnolipids biosynthesis 3-oxoacyl-reductase [Rhodofomes roseus]